MISAIDLILKNEKCAWLWGSLKQMDNLAKVLPKHRFITNWASKQNSLNILKMVSAGAMQRRP
jgi:hypothetical protein